MKAIFRHFRWLVYILVAVLPLQPGYASFLDGKPSNPDTPFPKKPAPASSDGPKFRRPTPSAKSRSGADPIRFTLTCDKKQVNVGEQIELTVTAQLLDVAPNSMFFLPGSNAYTLKMIVPDGFQQTDGDFGESTSDELTKSTHSSVTYHLRGYFTSAADGTCFRLLRSHARANSQSLFEEKATLCVATQAGKNPVASSRKPASYNTPPQLYVRSLAASYQGYLDVANCDVIYGWAWDANSGTLPVTVELLANGTPFAEAVADQYRGDLQGAGIGDGRHGYSIVPPASIKNSQAYTITARIKNTSFMLTGSHNFQCAGTTPPPPPPPTTGACAASIARINYNWDSGNNSLGIQLRTSSNTSAPQVKVSGPANFDWTGAFTTNNADPNWFWARANLSTGTYTVSVRPEGDTGAGCSFTFGTPIPSSGQLYPTTGGTGCTPPAAPNITAPSGTQVCNSSSVTLQANNCGGTVTWSGGQTGPSISVNTAGTYTATCTGTGASACASGPSNSIAVTSCTPPPTSGGCISFAETCSGNNSEVRNVTVNVVSEGNYPLTITYRSTEGDRDGIVRAGGSSQTVRFIGTQTTVTTAGIFHLMPGDNTVGLSSGQGGGYLCFSKICVGSGGSGCTPPAAPSISAPSGTQICNNSSVTLQANNCGGTTTWSGGQTGPSISVNTAGTYTATCTGTGASACASGPSNSIAVTNCTPTTGGIYNRVLYVGNSITLHPGSGPFIVNAQNGKRGMAATSPDKDYVRLMLAKLQTLNPSVVSRTLASDEWYQGGMRDETTGGYVEAQLTKDWLDLSRFDPIANWKPDLVYIRLGENVIEAELNNQAEVQARLKALIDKFISQSPEAKVVLSTSVWDNPRYDQAIRAVAAERNYPIADFSDMWANRGTNRFYAFNTGPGNGPVYGDPGIDKHPNDNGMIRIADGLWNVTPRTTNPGSNTTAPPTNSDYVAVADQGWSGADLKFIENGQIKVGFKRTVGATVCYAALISNLADNFVNDYQVSDALPGDPRAGTTFSDKGRQWQFGSDYWTPGNNFITPGGKNTSTLGFDTGGNSVQGGSLGRYYAESTIIASAIYDHPTRGREFYAKVRPKLWAVPNEDGPIILEQWVSLVGRSVRYFTRHTVEPHVSSQTTYQSRSQENPCAYITADMYNHRSQFGGPGSGTVDRTPPGSGSGQKFSSSVYSSGCWIGGYRDGGGLGVTLYSPGNSDYITAQFGTHFGNGASNDASYISNGQKRNYDNAGVYEDYGYIILGTESQAMATIATLPPPDQSYNFDFSKTNVFANGDCRVIRQPNNDLVWYMGDSKTDGGTTSRNGSFMSPARAWVANNLTTISFDMTVSAGSTMSLKWIKPGVADSPGTEFRKNFSVIGDGQRRTYTVSTADSNWNGIISAVGLEARTENTPSGAQVTVHRFYKP